MIRISTDTVAILSALVRRYTPDSVRISCAELVAAALLTLHHAGWEAPRRDGARQSGCG